MTLKIKPLGRICARCGGYVHHFMPWQKNWRKVTRGKFKGRLVHKNCKERN